ncbi:MAG: MASE1 domain-containing protein, partial [Pseudomonadota bacterium]
MSATSSTPAVVRGDNNTALAKYLPARFQNQWLLFLLELALFVMVYHFVSTFNVKFSSINANVAYIWLAAGISYAAIFLRGYRFWLGVLLGEISEIFFLQMPDLHQILVGFGNALGLVIGVWLTKRFMQNQYIFYRASHVASFILLGAVISSVISASIGISSTYLNRASEIIDVSWFSIWWPWCVSNIVGILVIAPVFMSCFQHNRPGLYHPQRFEFLLMLASGSLVAWFVFGTALDDGLSGYPLTFCFMPFILWAAFRFSQRETNLVIFALSTVAVVGTEMGLGPFALTGSSDIGIARAEPAVLLQTFIAVLCVTTFFLLGVINERKRLEESLSESNRQLNLARDQLEETVVQRTAELRETSKQYKDIFENALEGIYQIAP